MNLFTLPPPFTFVSIMCYFKFLYVRTVCLCVCFMWQALMQAHDSVAVHEMAEENETQNLGETVKLVRLEKTRDTPLVRCRLLVFLRQCYYYALLSLYANVIFIYSFTAIYLPHNHENPLREARQ